MSEKRYCQAKTIKDLPCRKLAKEGSRFCAIHSKIIRSRKTQQSGAGIFSKKQKTQTYQHYSPLK